jgi:uncharacterized protein (DUF1330 family)
MAAYLIANTNVHDLEAYEEYKRRVAPLIAKFGGKYLVRGGAHAVLEGNWRPTRLVVVEFPDRAAIDAWYASPDYAPLIPLRHRAAESDLLVVEGI